MVNRLIKSIVLFLFLCSSYGLAKEESYVERELLKSYEKVEIAPLNGEPISPCLGVIIERYVRHNSSSKRLLYVVDCKIGNRIQIQRHWFSFKGFNFGYVSTRFIKKGQVIEVDYYKEVLVEDFGSLLGSDSNHKAITDLQIGTVLSVKNTISVNSVLVGDELDVLINYRSARIKTIGVALENALPGELMKIRVNERALNSTLGTLGEAYVN